MLKVVLNHEITETLNIPPAGALGQGRPPGPEQVIPFLERQMMMAFRTWLRLALGRSAHPGRAWGCGSGDRAPAAADSSATAAGTRPAEER